MPPAGLLLAVPVIRSRLAGHAGPAGRCPRPAWRLR